MSPRRFVVLGNSPHRLNTPNLTQLILASTVIGVNRAPLYGIPLDHWVVWDTHDMMEDREMVRALRVIHSSAYKAWLRISSTDIREKFPPFLSRKTEWFDGAVQGEDWQKQRQWFKKPYRIPCRGSVCTSAAAIAYLQGADEVWLVGVDFATPGPTPDWTRETLETTAKFVNEFFKDFPIPVYKTYNGGPLDLPYKEFH